ncbi:unnamed protein product [Somion occarium]|uniref:Uncharacterized protein n=1 Tax=Somion occarium TaxID=3059160 RepID=A0ABP1E1W5_9APHY
MPTYGHEEGNEADAPADFGLTINSVHGRGFASPVLAMPFQLVAAPYLTQPLIRRLAFDFSSEHTQRIRSLGYIVSTLICSVQNTYTLAVVTSVCIRWHPLYPI